MLPDSILGVVDPRFPVIVTGVALGITEALKPILVRHIQVLVIRQFVGGVRHARIVTETPGPVKRETK